MSPDAELRHFQATHQVAHQRIGRHEWSVLSAGSGPNVVVLVPGAGGDAESMFPLITALEQRLCVVAIGRPASVTTAIEIIDGMKTILDARRIDRCCLLGHSLGGTISQRFLAHHPSRVDSLILANTAGYTRFHVAILRLLLLLLARLPPASLEHQLEQQFERFFNDHPDKDFWVTYFVQQASGELGPNGLANRYRGMRDLLSGMPLSPTLVSGWSGRVMLLESNDETGFTQRGRDALRTQFPNARRVSFENAGHFSYLARRQAFASAVLEFVLRAPIAQSGE